MPIPVTQAGKYNYNRRCKGVKGCRQKVRLGNAHKLLEKDGDDIKVTDTLCILCARAMAKLSDDDNAQIVKMTEEEWAQ